MVILQNNYSAILIITKTYICIDISIFLLLSDVRCGFVRYVLK